MTTKSIHISIVEIFDIIELPYLQLYMNSLIVYCIIMRKIV